MQTVETLTARCNEHQLNSLRDSMDWGAALFQFVHTRASTVVGSAQQVFMKRMLAGALLPLYRSLACGGVEEVLSVLRRHLADTVALAAVFHEFDEMINESATTATHSEKSPHEMLKSLMQIDLELLAERMLVCGHGWNGRDPSELKELIQRDVQTSKRPPWGEATILWRLAGELIADRAEFVVPRDWIKVPVPWNDVSEHWRTIESLLVSTTRAASGAPINPRPTAEARVNEKPTPDGRPNTTQLPEATTSASRTSAQHAMNARPHDQADIDRLRMEIEIANSIDSLLQATRGSVKSVHGESKREGPHKPNKSQAVESLIPKIIVAEVRSHNDPAFVSVVRRQLAICRNEERTLCLISVCVLPETNEDFETQPTLSSLGLASWQQKLVNWMAEQPEIRDPNAFLSNEGELILCVMDLERNVATNLLRQGLLEVLTGRQVTADVSSTLSRVNLPARYHSGIGSVSSPTANFEAEQLIEATYRCLAAAERNGKAAIKSIEVF